MGERRRSENDSRTHHEQGKGGDTFRFSDTNQALTEKLVPIKADVLKVKRMGRCRVSHTVSDSKDER